MVSCEWNLSLTNQRKRFDLHLCMRLQGWKKIRKASVKNDGWIKREHESKMALEVVLMDCAMKVHLKRGKKGRNIWV